MSHHGAFLTSAYVESVRPTVLEVVAEEGLITTLQPAFNQLIKVLAAQLDPTGQPGRSLSAPASGLSRLLPAVSDELFLVLNSALQLHHLRLFSASFSENFYGLERLSASSPPSLRLSYLWLVLVPYLHRKLEQLFLQLREAEADGIGASTQLAAKARWAFVNGYPFLHALWTMADLAMLMAFSFQSTGHHSVASYLAGYQLIHVTPERRQLQEERSDALLRGSHGLRHVLLSAVLAATRAVSLGLELGSFLLQVVDHWYSTTDSSLKVASQGRLPCPPPTAPSAGGAPGSCPLCRRPRRGSTVVAVSGVVYCYACIARHLRTENKCPVSGLRADENQLIRVFGRQE
jgi:peroxin-12